MMEQSKIAVVLIIVMTVIVFQAGKFYGESKVHIKKTLKRARRDAIIKMK